jgi:hypothetical protein
MIDLAVILTIQDQEEEIMMINIVHHLDPPHQLERVYLHPERPLILNSSNVLLPLVIEMEDRILLLHHQKDRGGEKDKVPPQRIILIDKF